MAGFRTGSNNDIRNRRQSSITNGVTVGGVVADAVVLSRSKATNGPREGALVLLVRYWRFLTIVWFVLLAVILFG